MDKSRLEYLLNEQKLSMSEIAKIEGVSRSTVHNYIFYKYKLREAPKPSISYEELYQMYVVEQISIRDISLETGFGERRIAAWLERYQIDTRPKGTNQNESINLERAIEIFKEHGHELLETEYKNAITPMQFRCRCGNVSKIRLSVVKRGSGCRKCGRQKGADAKRYTIEEIKAMFEAKGCKLLSTEYIPRKHLEYICHCGAKAKMILSNFQKGYDCINCKSLKFSGANNHRYNPEISDEEREGLGRYEKGYKAFKRSVFKRDNFTCKICRCKDKDQLVVHHLDAYKENPDKRTDLDNAVCLCDICHKAFHKEYGQKGTNKEQFLTFLKERGNGC